MLHGASIFHFKNIVPKIHSESFIAHNAVVIGNVEIGEQSGVWFSSVIRGDVAPIRIGSLTNIQDGTTIHVTRPNHVANKTGASGGPTMIGNKVTVGHNCIIHACTIGNNVFVGMGSILMDLSIVEDNAMVAAGSLLTCGKVVKSGQLWSGRPAKFMRDLTEEELSFIPISAQNYWDLAMCYR